MENTLRFNHCFKIADSSVGDNCPVYIVAEAGVAHFGNEEKAYRLVDLAAQAGADAIKFQIFDVDALISNESPEWRERLGSRVLPYESFRRIQCYCRDKKIVFFATAHDEKSLDFLLELDAPVYKVGSGEVGNWPYLQRIAALDKPLILSTGMYHPKQVVKALEIVSKAGNRNLALLHCVTRYPVPPQEAALGNIASLREKFHVVTGYSDHTSGFHFPLVAVALGARIVEKHITLDYNVPNAQDWKVSCGPADLGEFVRQIREIEVGLGTRESGPTQGERESLTWAAKSLVPKRDIKKGEVIAAADLVSKRPGTGISPSEIEQVIGRRARVDIPEDRLIQWEHLA